MRIRQTVQAVFWVLVYLTLTLAPLFVMLIGPVPERREFLLEFSVALGFCGLAMLALQFALTARFQVVKSPYGSDIVYHFHRQISLVAFALIISHPLLLFIKSSDYLGLLNLFQAPWRARAGVTALIALIILIALSLWRKRFKIDYTQWRIWHGVLATAAVSLALTHIVLVNHYLNTPLKRALWIGYAVFWIGLLIYVRILKPFLLLRRPFVIKQVIPERGKAWTLVLEPLNHSGVRFMPGQFAWITIRSSPFADTEHPFSFSSSAANPKRLKFTIKELGDFTRNIKDLIPGEQIYVDGPFGSFSVDRHPHAKGFVFIAGGIGITPIMSMLETLADRSDKRSLLLIYANKDWESVTFREKIELLEKHLNLKVVHVLEKPPEGWQGESGFANLALLDRYIPKGKLRNTIEVFVCGPPPMMNAVEKALIEIGVPFGDFHSERFNLV